MIKAPTLTPQQLESLLLELRQQLRQLYVDRLQKVILYGSYARGDYHAGSDVDVMVVLNEEKINTGAEFDKLWDLIWPFFLRFQIWVSIKVVPQKKYDASDLFFYQNVRREGVTL